MHLRDSQGVRADALFGQVLRDRPLVKELLITRRGASGLVFAPRRIMIHHGKRLDGGPLDDLGGW